ncbi:MAG TPA: BrnA antitoxin family protein [Albidovulum sp.]|uniref:BrnA antitoxin family protein n=1 Tax=Albidovulum sp. TaxID=1872424 RepID=UPI002BF12F2B|nr:BrnA antitoxin family protein [Albidovulum sp.]
MADLQKLTKTQRPHYHYMADAMRRLEHDLHNAIHLSNKVPTGWHEIARNRGRGKTRRVTIRIEEDVLRFFRSMGEGYGPRINEVLRVWMHGRLAGVIGGAETTDYYRDGRHFHDGGKPGWGAAYADAVDALGEEVARDIAEGEAEFDEMEREAWRRS